MVEDAKGNTTKALVIDQAPSNEIDRLNSEISGLRDVIERLSKRVARLESEQHRAAIQAIDTQRAMIDQQEHIMAMVRLEAGAQRSRDHWAARDREAD
jgi:predicted  nucleic acid-binding Zn-ribbon protein